MKKSILFLLVLITVFLTACTEQENPVIITLDSMGGEELESVVINQGDSLILPIPTNEGYIFAGWYEDTDFTMPFSIVDAPQESIILYAKWIESSLNIWRIKINDQSTHKISISILIIGEVNFIGFDARLYYDDTSLTINEIDNTLSATINTENSGEIVFNYVNALSPINKDTVVLTIDFDIVNEFLSDSLFIEVIDMISIKENYEIYSVDFSLIQP